MCKLGTNTVKIAKYEFYQARYFTGLCGYTSVCDTGAEPEAAEPSAAVGQADQGADRRQCGAAEDTHVGARHQRVVSHRSAQQRQGDRAAPQAAAGQGHQAAESGTTQSSC